MNIQEATKKALAEDKCITIPADGVIRLKIKPTNTMDNCILIDKKGTPLKKDISALSHGWQPSADHLISDEWIVVDQHNGE